MPDHLKQEFLASGLLAIGILECWRQRSEALVIADRIEQYSPIAALNADQLRTIYHSGRGDVERAAFYRQRVEMRALQLGAAWQVVTFGPVQDHVNSLWLHNVLMAKRAAAELARLSEELPSLRHEALRARATYLVLAGRYREVIELMRADDAPPSLVGWSRVQGILARAHNRLGQHERAREVCLAALAGRSDEDLGFVVMNLHVQLELAVANAALGEHASAREQVARLLERHASAGPLLLGAVHETGARVALYARDFEHAREHSAAMRARFAPIGLASLLELCDQLDEQLRRTEGGDTRQVGSRPALTLDDDHLLTRVELLLTHTEAGFEQRARRGLEIACDLTGAKAGFLLSRGTPGGAVYKDEQAPAPALVQWALSRHAAHDDENRTDHG